ncbi:MAG: hypothetical protein JO001_01870 [Alphaproteobacteria bacterium]|nr:hypothetical protein [Alphaproteobacteria bacterium]
MTDASLRGARRIVQRVLDAVERARLTLPPRVVGEPGIGQIARPAHQNKVGLDLVVAGLGFLNETTNAGLVEDLADRHGAHRRDDRVKVLSSLFYFSL